MVVKGFAVEANGVVFAAGGGVEFAAVGAVVFFPQQVAGFVCGDDRGAAWVVVVEGDDGLSVVASTVIAAGSVIRYADRLAVDEGKHVAGGAGIGRQRGQYGGQRVTWRRYRCIRRGRNSS